MKRFIFALISIIYFFISCDTSTKAYDNDIEEDSSLNLVRYAENFEIYPYKSGYKLIIKNLSKRNDTEFYVFNDSIKIPSDLNDKIIIRTPINSAIAFSSTQWAVFQKLGELDKVKGILESNYTKNEEILRLVSEGEIIDVGMSTNVNTEKVIHLQPDLILYTL